MSNDTCCETLNDSKSYREAQCILFLAVFQLLLKSVVFAAHIASVL